MTIAIVRFVMAGFWWAVLAAGLPCCCISTLMCVCVCMRFSSEHFIEMGERLDKEAVANRTIVFEGKVRPGTGKCVCSWPGKYESAWDALVTGSRSGDISAAVVFLPRGFKAFRPPRRYPQRGKATGQLLVRSPLWGAKAVGLPLVDKVDSKHRKCTQGRR